MIQNHNKGKLITFEGIDYSGKSEQYRRTKNILTADFPEFKAEYLKEPRNPEIYDLLFKRHPNLKLNEMHPFAFQAFYFAERVGDYKNIIIPALESGVSVIMDRGPVSVAYGASQIGDINHLMTIQEQFFLGAEVPFIWPDANLIFDIPVEVFSERAEKAGRPRDEFENPQTQRVARDNYHFFAGTYPNCHIIDGNRDPKDIFDDAWKIIYKILAF